MKHYLLHLRAPIRALFALLAFSAVSLSVDAEEPPYSVVFSNSTSWPKGDCPWQADAAA